MSQVPDERRWATIGRIRDVLEHILFTNSHRRLLMTSEGLTLTCPTVVFRISPDAARDIKAACGVTLEQPVSLCTSAPLLSTETH